MYQFCCENSSFSNPISHLTLPCLQKIDCTEANGLAGVLNLSIQDAAIEGAILPEYGKLTSVKVIDLNYNFIGGSIPEQIFDISGLRELDLNDNRLTGTLSKRIGELRNLEFLQLHNNQLDGFIPGQLGNIISLGTYVVVTICCVT